MNLPQKQSKPPRPAEAERGGMLQIVLSSLRQRVRLILCGPDLNEDGPCRYCGEVVPAFHGLRENGMVWCSEEHRVEEWATRQW